MLKEIVVTNKIEVGAGTYACTYNVGYAIKAYTDVPMEYVEAVCWDETGMSTDRNKLKFNLNQILYGTIPEGIKVRDER